MTITAKFTSSAIKVCLALVLALSLVVGLSIQDDNWLACISAPSTSFNQAQRNTHELNCANSYLANKSWLIWLTGGSQSAYFHYLDLIELLHPRK